MPPSLTEIATRRRAIQKKLGELRASRDEGSRQFSPAEEALIDSLTSEDDALVQTEQIMRKTTHRPERLAKLSRPPGERQGPPDTVPISWTSGGSAPVVVEGRGAHAAVDLDALDDGGFDRDEGVASILQAVYRSRVRGEPTDERLTRMIHEGTGSGGGYAVPIYFAALVAERALGSRPLLSRVNRIPVETDEYVRPLLTSRDHSSGAPFGITFTSVAEEGTFGTSNVNFARNKGKILKRGTVVPISNEFLADTSAESRRVLNRMFTDALAWDIERMIVAGSGVGEPLGILNSPGRVTVNKESGQAADTVVTANLLKMYSRLYPGSEDRAIALCNKTTFQQLAELELVVGTGGGNAGILQFGNVAGVPSRSMFGMPLFWSEFCTPIGDEGDVVFCDPTMYDLFDRQEIRIDISTHVYFETDRTAFKIYVRYDGSPQMDTALTPLNGDTLSGFVTLAARA